MQVDINRTETEWQPKKGDSLEGLDEQKFKELIAEGELDFDGWTKLILEVENLFHDDIEKICLAYDSFLSEFPLCYGYWRKYADHMIRSCTIDKAVDVFERAVQSATYSVGVWVDYCSFAVSIFEDDNDIRRLFKRALSFVGKDYLCHTLWDMYLEFEFSRQQWSSLAHVYIQTLKFPSKKLHHYHESFQKLATTWKEEMQCLNDMDLQSDPKVEYEVSSCYTDAEISCVIKDLLDASDGMEGAKALAKYLSVGTQLYHEASELDEKIRPFEAKIRRPYFHVKELDICQLENWHEYLNLVETLGSFDWAVKLYERCLIPCANYPEFWMRYIDFMESKGGREIATFALARATEIFLKRMPVIHLFNARFKENIRDVSGAHVALLHYETESDLSFVETVSIKANMERRLGNFIAASNMYKEAVEIAAAKQKFDILPMLYINFSRLQYTITSNSDAARDILIDGIKCLPNCKLLLEELIKFGMMHGGHTDIHILDSIINDVIFLGPSQGMDTKEAKEISILYLQFVDLCGTIDDIRKAWNRHIKCFPDSARMSTHKFSVVNSIRPILLKMAAVRRQENPGSLPSHPSVDGSLDISVQSPSTDKILEPPENDDSQPNQAASEWVPDKKSPLLEDHEIPLYQATVNELQSEADESLQGGMQHSSQDVSKHLTEDIKTDTDMSSHNLTHYEVANEVKALEPSEERSKENEFWLEHDHNSEHNVNGLPLERLSLGHLDREALDSISTANQEGETFVETNLSSESMVGKEPPQETGKLNGITPEGAQSNGGDNLESSLWSAQAPDAVGIQTEMASPSSLASQQNIKKTEPVLQRTHEDHGSWHQSSADRVHQENKPGYRRHSHKRMHQRQQMSPRRQHSRSGTGTQVPMSQGYPGQSMYSQSLQAQQGGQSQCQYSTSAAQPNLAHTWSTQNVHPQNFAPSQTPPVPLPAYPQPQIAQHPMQSNDQLGQMQNNQAYNQMWQYYYYQQQQQQFVLQQQQPQNQESLTQQQVLQQQYQQQQYLQQQSLQFQQQQQLIQQQQYLQQQQQLQPLGSYQQQVPPPNHQIYLQQQEQEKGQGQITPSQVQTQSDLSREGQDTLPCRNDDASETVLPTISPNSHH